MRVRFDGLRTRAVGGAGAVAVEAERRCRLAELRGVLRAVRVMAPRASDSVSIHLALDEVVALHPVLVTRAVGVVREGGLAKLVVLETPVVLEPGADLEANGPIVIPTRDGVL